MNRFGGFKPRRLGEDAARERLAARSRMRVLASGAIGAVLACVVVLAVENLAGDDDRARIDTLEQENRRLGDELGVGRLALEMERATRAELERQLADMNEALKKRQSELVFLKSQLAKQPPR